MYDLDQVLERIGG